MILSSLRRFTTRALPAPRQAGRGSRQSQLRCEELEPRLQPSVFFFSTNAPDGRVATISEPSNAHNSHVEFESADDFDVPTETVIKQATFTGLLTGGATPQDVSNVSIEIYRVFPDDSDVGRTSGPPTFSTPQVPTRVNSPADIAFEERDSAAKELNFRADVLATTFTAQASVSSADKIAVKSGGNGPATGEEVEFHVIFRNHPLDLPAGQYFFVPKVGLTDGAPAAANFLWLSAPKPIVPPGTPFTPDRQSWMRDDPDLAPDWLRIGTDIIGGTTFNASFSLFGQTAPDSQTEIEADSAASVSPIRGLSPELIGSLIGTTNFAVPPATPPADGVQHEPSKGRAPLATDHVPSAIQPRDLHQDLWSGLAPSKTHQHDSAFIDWRDGFLPALA
jgi:hypothetical protein